MQQLDSIQRRSDAKEGETGGESLMRIFQSCLLEPPGQRLSQGQDSIQTAMNCIEFGQYMTQAMWVKDSTLLQLPHYTPDEIKHCTKKGITTIAQYRAQDEADRRGMVEFTDQQKQDVKRYLRDFYPDISVEAKVFVDDDEDDKVYEGDICTIQVILPYYPLSNPYASSSSSWVTAIIQS